MGKTKAATREAHAPSNVTSISAARKPRAATAAAKVEAANSLKSDAAPAVIVFGKDESGKAHASWFAEANTELAIKAAGLMGFQVLRVTSPDIAAKALELAQGRVFASGKGFVPFCKMPAYEALCGFEGAFAPPAPPEPQPEPPLAVTTTPQRWEDLAVGSLVLASVGPDEGWFEAVVTEARGESIFLLRWQGWPEDVAFVRRADGLALLPEPAASAHTTV